MNRLNKLYQTMENLKDLGLSINADLIQEANELEEELIQKEVLPILTKTIEPALRQVQRELVLVVDYKPDQPLSVHLSRKRNFTAGISDAKEMVLDPDVLHEERESYMDNRLTHGPAHALSVIFPDGTVIAEKNTVETVISVVKKIGVAEVRKVVEDYNITLNKVPLISNRRDSKYGKSQKELGGGWLLITHCNTYTKKRLLDKISDILHLGLIVKLGDKI